MGVVEAQRWRGTITGPLLVFRDDRGNKEGTVWGFSLSLLRGDHLAARPLHANGAHGMPRGKTKKADVTRGRLGHLITSAYS